MKTTKADKNLMAESGFNIFHFEEWLVVLSSPRILQAMQRVPPREHLLRMLDAYLPYARSTGQFTSRSHDWQLDPQKRGERALELRAAIERWSSPTISREITQAARALLREDGYDASDEVWDAHEIESPPNDYLLWPEGVPLELRAQSAPKPEEPPVPEHGQARALVSAASSGPIWGCVPRPPFRRKIEDVGADAPARSMEVAPWEEDFTEIACFHGWLHVLSSPRILDALRRMPPREHLLTMLDAYLPYARSERRWTNDKTPRNWRLDPQKREARALELRAAIERWSSPEISREITEAARALAREDGLREPEEGWDANVYEDETPLEEYLLWPESPELRRKKEKPEVVKRALLEFLFPEMMKNLPPDE
jgi:hypothetical protein